MSEPGNSSRAGRAAFTHPDFALYQLARFFIVTGLEMQSVAVGWQIYEITKRPIDLGLVGLAQFTPGILLFLISGHAADRLEWFRKSGRNNSWPVAGRSDIRGFQRAVGGLHDGDGSRGWRNYLHAANQSQGQGAAARAVHTEIGAGRPSLHPET